MRIEEQDVLDRVVGRLRAGEHRAFGWLLPGEHRHEAVKHYHAGEFCSTSKTAVYSSLGLTCVTGRLKKK